MACLMGLVETAEESLTGANYTERLLHGCQCNDEEFFTSIYDKDEVLVCLTGDSDSNEACLTGINDT